MNWKYIYRTLLLASLVVGGLFLYQWWQGGQNVEAPAVYLPDFSFTVSTPHMKIAVGSTASYDAHIAFLDDFNSTSVALWARGVPAGITAIYAPNPLPHQGAAAFTLRGDGTEKAGTYRLTMGATAESITRTQDVELIISADPDFEINISPKTQSVAAGKGVSYEATVTSINGFSGPVNLSIYGLPNGSSASFTLNSLTPPATSVFTINTTADIPQEQYSFSVTGASGDNTRSIQAFLNVTAPGSAWTISSIGTTGSKNNTVRVGPARNDGINRIYVGTLGTGRVIEFSWDGSSWSNPLDIGGSPIGEEIHNMTIGSGRNDGVLRIYAGSIDDNLYEFTYSGSGWTQTTVGAPSGDAFHAVVGSGRNDGVNRVYAVRDTSAWEYTWTGTDWSAVLIGKVSRGVVHGIALGDGRGEGSTHIYIASTGGGVYEGTFSDGTWSLVSMGDSGDTRNVGVGIGRNDGVQHVYAALLQGGRVREFTWSGTSWKFSELTDSVGAQLVHAYVLAGRGDGVERVYTSSGNGNSYEFSWNGSGWTTYTLGGGTGYMYGFHFGEGRNDGIVRLYGGSFNTRVYEYTWSAP